MGDWDSGMPKPGYVYETTVLVHAFNEMANNLRASFKALREQLVYDSLTRLYSRQGLVEICENQSDLCHGSLFLLGINKFRDINDSVGHHNGDQLLVSIAERLKQQFRDNALLARIGGDEFAVFLSNVDTETKIKQTERRLQQLFSTPIYGGRRECSDEDFTWYCTNPAKRNHAFMVTQRQHRIKLRQTRLTDWCLSLQPRTSERFKVSYANADQDPNWH